MADLRVAMVLPNHAPHFGRDWARAATLAGVHAPTIEFVRSFTLPERRGPVATDGERYEILRFDLRPSRAAMPLVARVQAQRVRSALSAIALDHGRVDLMHTHYYHQTRWVRHVRGRPPYVHTEHSLALLRGDLGERAGYPLSRAGRRMAQRGLSDAACVIPVSQCLASSMATLGLRGEVRVIPNPVDPRVFAPSGDRDRSLVVSVGRLSPDKQPDRVLRALQIARLSRPDLRLEWIGEGGMRAELETMIESMGLADHVSLLGRLAPQRVAEHIGHAAAYVNSSRVETFGVAVAESLMTGTPVVAPRMAAVPELVDERNGVLVDPDDDDALAAGLLEVLDRPFDHSAIAADAKARWSSEIVGTNLVAVYEGAVAR